MGFLKRFLSLGSRRHKKKRAPAPTEEAISYEERRKREREHEATASRLLRSSSSHFSVVSEVDYSSLPPIPHPINSLTPISSTSSDRSASIQSRGTYVVKVIGREVHTRTEFPNAYPLETPPRSADESESDGPARSQKLSAVTPRDKHRMHRLRQDPSVASLLDMYDSHGRLDEKAFSNSFSIENAEGHAQVKRSGSTFRQLLGEPEQAARNSTEGDISWAERFLGERDVDASASSAESLAIETPVNNHFSDNLSAHVNPNITIVPDHDHSMTDSDYYPIFSSMDVELSMATNETADLPKPTRPQDPSTPRRASEVFKFLLAKEPSRPVQDLERPLPALPLINDADSSTDSAPANHNSSATPSEDTSFLSPNHNDHSGSTDAPSSAGSIIDDPPQDARILNRTPITLKEGPRAQQVNMTPSSAPTSPLWTHQSARLPEHLKPAHPPERPTSARPLERLTSRRPRIPVRDILRTTTNAKTPKQGESYTPVPARKVQRRTASHASSTLTSGNGSTSTLAGDKTVVVSTSAKPSRIRPPRERDDGKENGPSPNNSMDAPRDAPRSSSRLGGTRLPMTPARARAVAVVDEPPSPALSTELSPIAQQMMAEAREQRKRARDAEERKRHRFAHVLTSN
ncbi:hypothetical protein EWM64_g4839 [Hericium alpestre]|uniref:Uncharacterized protein n=1 Tax=Hericium alpestre TaxID=135208 RepID=A0A4Y9ZYA0_9AGAM|nr:hypothetical protein EWM64_g4839 [Hericium alpestre]